MRTYDAIDVISKKVIEDNLCDAILLKGSIGRGDDDEYSDVDMYLIVSPEKWDAVLEKRTEYLSAYGEMIYLEDVNFGLPQKVAIYVNGPSCGFVYCTNGSTGCQGSYQSLV